MNRLPDKVSRLRAARIVGLIISTLIVYYSIEVLYIYFYLKNTDSILQIYANYFYHDNDKYTLIAIATRDILVSIIYVLILYYFLKGSKRAYLFLLTWASLNVGSHLLTYFLDTSLDIGFFLQLTIATVVIFTLLQKDLRESFYKQK